MASLQDFLDIHKGETAFICGSGCSLRDIKEDKLDGKIFAINLALLKFKSVDYTVMTDGSVKLHDFYYVADHKIKGKIFKCGEAVKGIVGESEKDVYLDRVRSSTIDKASRQVVIADAVPTAVHIAYVMGFERIILLGNDLEYDEQGRKYFTEYAGITVTAPNQPNANEQSQDEWLNITRTFLLTALHKNKELPLYTTSKVNDGISKLKNRWV